MDKISRREKSREKRNKSSESEEGKQVRQKGLDDSLGYVRQILRFFFNTFRDLKKKLGVILGL